MIPPPSRPFDVPKFLLGRESLDDRPQWVLRSKGPFLLARIDTNWHFSCWPTSAQGEVSSDRFYKIVAKLAQYQGKALKSGPLPSSWSYNFEGVEYPPSHLFVTNDLSGFEGVLRLTWPKAFFLPGKGLSFDATRWIDDPGEKTDLYVEDSLEWYKKSMQ